jgi:hypothetical protein
LLSAIACLCSIPSGCSEGTLLDERFQDTRLLNWTVVDEEGTIEGPSEWEVEPDGWLHQQSNIWGPRGDFLNRWYGTFITAGSEGWRDYTLYVKARADDDDGFGVIVRLKDNQHFYRLLFLKDGMNGGPVTRLDKRDGPDYTQLWSSARGYRTADEMLVQVDVTGDTISGSVNGERLFEVKDGAYRAGKIGLFCFAQGGQSFDNVRVIRR